MSGGYLAANPMFRIGETGKSLPLEFAFATSTD
jgi:hypothetical protein